MSPLSPHEWRLCRESNCDAADLMPGLRDRFWAAQWLEQFKGDTSLMSTMRSLLAQEERSWQVSSMPDPQIIAAIADLLSRGVLHIHTRPSVAQGGRQQASSQGAESVQAPPGPRNAPASAIPVRLAPLDAPTFSADIHLAAQVATLVAASAQGSAFCEH